MVLINTTITVVKPCMTIRNTRRTNVKPCMTLINTKRHCYVIQKELWHVKCH